MAGRRRAANNPARSVRIEDPIWDRAVNRATAEGTTISEVIQLFVEGYSKGMLNAPRVQVVYQTPRPAGVTVPGDQPVTVPEPRP
jgi:hypothetical protein